MKKIFFDLDGTIVDFSDRYFFLYSYLLKKYGQKALPRRSYLHLKRNRISEEQILSRTVEKVEVIQKIIKERLLKIENNDYLRYDKFIPGAEKTLARLSRNFELFLVSNRKDEKNFLREAERLGLRRFFRELMLYPQGKGQPYLRRAEAISRKSPGEDALIVGDTEDDIRSAKRLGLTSIAVLSGIRTRSFLEKLNPDYIIKSVNQIFSVLER